MEFLAGDGEAIVGGERVKIRPGAIVPFSQGVLLQVQGNREPVILRAYVFFSAE